MRRASRLLGRLFFYLLVVFVMSGVNPVTRTLAVYNRQTLIDFQDLGYGSAISVAILVIIFVFVLLYMRTIGKEALK